MQDSNSIQNKENDSTAILFVHGILGNREFFNFLLPYVPARWTIVNLLLEGHGGSPADFAGASMEAWKKQVHDAVSELRATHRKVMIAAHSMGTLFAIREALEKNADSLFLLNIPMRIRPTWRLFITPLKIISGKISSDDVWTRAAIDACGIEVDSNLFHYIGWIPRYCELFAEIRSVRAICRHLEVTACVFFSSHDEMVSPRSADIFKDNPFVFINMLHSSGHYYYTPEDRSIIISHFIDVCNDLQK